MSECPDPILHVTSVESWHQIQEGGFILSYQGAFGPKRTGIDTHRISGWRGFALDDVYVVERFKQFMRTQRGWKEAIGLVIRGDTVHWSESLKTAQLELSMTDVRDVYHRFGTVVKTEPDVRIPVGAICRTV